MHHPLTNLGTNMSCDRKNFAGWPCDEHAEALRQTFLVAGEADRSAALGNLHRYLAQVQPYRILGQYDQPVALRANVTGLLTSPVIVYWNIDKN
jgi:peptide/nickel transport system substrate-binding protein